jgi:hypothetical protein
LYRDPGLYRATGERPMTEIFAQDLAQDQIATKAAGG